MSGSPYPGNTEKLHDRHWSIGEANARRAETYQPSSSCARRRKLTMPRLSKDEKSSRRIARDRTAVYVTMIWGKSTSETDCRRSQMQSCSQRRESQATWSLLSTLTSMYGLPLNPKNPSRAALQSRLGRRVSSTAPWRVLICCLQIHSFQSLRLSSLTLDPTCPRISRLPKQ